MNTPRTTREALIAEMLGDLDVILARVEALPAAITARVSVEAGIAMPWRGIVGDRGRSVSIEHFGASADYKTLFQKFGITTDAVVAAAHEVLG